MNPETKEKLDYIKSVLKEANNYAIACNVLAFDQETICPPRGMQAQGEANAYLANQLFKLVKSDEFISASEYLYEHIDELDDLDLDDLDLDDIDDLDDLF